MTTCSEELDTDAQKGYTSHFYLGEIFQVVIFEEVGISLLDPLKHLFLIPSVYLLYRGDCGSERSAQLSPLRFG